MPLPAPAIPEQARPAATGADSGWPEPVTPAESGPSVVSAAESGHSELPVPEEPAPTPAGAVGPPGLPLSLRPPGADPDQSSLPMSLRPPASPAAAGLLAQARRGLAEAAQETRPAERFIGAYLAALRGAAAVLAARGRPHRGRARPASTWVLLDSVAPELREWSAFFASNSATRAAAQAGITGKVTAESAAGLVGAATPFLELVRRLVHGLPITGEAHVA
ncbi:SAV_6107 family HEPN domain-containing protein [Amycolatopsis sp. CA-126428]|uniref:SAV_6107 family HEPN domain-containing protein n=1 Tax=Amycolatopsis sp. CA-126428 TaxID=2073158 RepID=UPI001E429F26|nr:SAV_6107 family HEPN domain-containing protein [Amycolatopsis sp. CA-126428]